MCNKKDECGDESDEEFCGDNCGGWDELFQCKDGQECVPATYKCEGQGDCDDNSDEDKELCKNNCGDNPGLFQCDNGKCMWNEYTCDGRTGDGYENCSDGSDEAEDLCKNNCGGMMKDRFQCADGTCIGKWGTCDGTPDCNDGSDEADCSG